MEDRGWIRRMDYRGYGMAEGLRIEEGREV